MMQQRADPGPVPCIQSCMWGLHGNAFNHEQSTPEVDHSAFRVLGTCSTCKSPSAKRFSRELRKCVPGKEGGLSDSFQYCE